MGLNGRARTTPFTPKIEVRRRQNVCTIPVKIILPGPRDGVWRLPGLPRLRAAQAELSADGRDRLRIEHLRGAGKHDLLLDADVLAIDQLKARDDGVKTAAIDCGERAVGHPAVEELGGFLVQGLGLAVFVFEPLDIAQHFGGAALAHARKQRLLFIGVMARAGFAKIPQRGLNGLALLGAEGAAVRLPGNLAKESGEPLNAAMTILKHADRVVETGVRLCANLHRHRVAPCLVPLFWSNPPAATKPGFHSK